MSFPNDIDPYNFFRQFFGGGARKRGEGRGWSFDDMFREFDEMRREMNRTFSEQFKNIENKVSKDLIKNMLHLKVEKLERSWFNSLWIFHDNRT